MSYAPAYSRPITISASTESQTYGLFALAIALTAVGFYIGGQYAAAMFGAGLHLVLFIVQLGIILTAGLWSRTSPLNYLIFAVLPVLSGIAMAPYLLYVMTSYTNGVSIVVNALSSTAFMAGAAAVFARTTSWNLGVMGKFLFFALLGLIGMSLIQWFVPALQTTTFNLWYSSIGIVIFAGFTAYDVQRIQQLGQAGANPFLLALSLYLDIYNLFLMILRFMTVFSGSRD